MSSQADRDWANANLNSPVPDPKVPGGMMPRYPVDPTQNSTAPDPKLRTDLPPKRDSPERKEQADFANWLLLQNSEGREIPFCWHATHTRSKASPGTPDFWVGINARSLWIEFKRDYSEDLGPYQEEFRVRCEVQRCEMHVVYSCNEAINLVEKASRPSLEYPTFVE